MGVFFTVAMKIEGQVKPSQDGEVAQAEIELICKRYGLRVIEDKSGFCSTGFTELEE